jgi:hypothetical protein
MQSHPDVLYHVARQSHRRAIRHAERERGATKLAPRPWLHLAVWSAIFGPIIGLGFLAYFARVILATVGG